MRAARVFGTTVKAQRTPVNPPFLLKERNSIAQSRAPGISVRPTARAGDGSDPFAVLERFHVAVAIVTVLGSTAFLLALMVMRAEERRE